LRLNEIKPGGKVRIEKVHGSTSTGRRLLDMGCIKGTELEVKRVAPLGDPIDIVLKGYHLSLRKSEAKEIEVEKI
jgi:Fe2+ transport system protein FeoA